MCEPDARFSDPVPDLAELKNDSPKGKPQRPEPVRVGRADRAGRDKRLAQLFTV